MTKTIINVLFITPLFFSDCGTNSLKTNDALEDSPGVIATQQFIWEDTSRMDIFYGGARLINTQIWYPSNKNVMSETPTPYFLFLDDVYDKIEGWSEEDYSNVRNVTTKSVMHTEISTSSEKKPLVMFSPSLGGNLSYYTYYAEMLALQGYVVMGVNHLYESEVVIDKEKNVFNSKLTFHDSLKTLAIPEQITAEKYREVKGERQKVLAEDLVFSLNMILKEPAFENVIDTTSIAAIGHSIGGAAAIYMSLLDKRIKAVIDLDGTPPSVALEKGIEVPFLFIEDLTDYKNHPGYAKLHKRRNDFCTLNRADAWRILIGGFNHNSFLDLQYYLANNDNDRRKERQNLDRVTKYIIDFLNIYLLDSEIINLQPIQSHQLEIHQFRKE